MKAALIREKLYDYIRVAEDKKVIALYTMLEDEIEVVQNYWDDKTFVQELDERAAELKSGKVKGTSWIEAKQELIASVKRRRK